MSAGSSATGRRRTPDPRLPVRARNLLRVRAVWTIPLVLASVVVAVMTALYTASVVNPLAHLHGLPVAVVNQGQGAVVGSQHLQVGQQVQAGTHTAGCGRRFPTIATGRGPIGIAADSRAGAIDVADYFSAAVSVLHGSRCNASVTTGCRATGRGQAVGSVPAYVAINPDTDTVYVTQLFQSCALSIFRAVRLRS